MAKQKNDPYATLSILASYHKPAKASTEKWRQVAGFDQNSGLHKRGGVFARFAADNSLISFANAKAQGKDNHQ